MSFTLVIHKNSLLHRLYRINPPARINNIPISSLEIAYWYIYLKQHRQDESAEILIHNPRLQQNPELVLDWILL